MSVTTTVSQVPIAVAVNETETVTIRGVMTMMGVVERDRMWLTLLRRSLVGLLGGLRLSAGRRSPHDDTMMYDVLYRGSAMGLVGVG